MTIKKSYFAVILITGLGALFSYNSASAQVAKAGVKVGLNVSNLYIDDVSDENARYGLNIGLYGQVLATETMALQLELLYSTKGAKAEYRGAFSQDVTFNLNYLDLPVMAVFKLGESAEIHLGAYGAYLLNANITYAGDAINAVDELDEDQLQSFDAGLVAGFGMNFGAAQVGARYNYGLSKIAKSDAAKNALGDSKNSCAQLYISFNLAK